MLIGCPAEIKNQEYRVGVTPAAAHEAVANGHDVIIQKGAGAGAGFPDAEYIAAGARIADTAEQVFAEADMIVGISACSAYKSNNYTFSQIRLEVYSEEK